MTKQQRTALAKYLLYLKRQMWLANWRVDIRWEDVEEDEYATMEATFGQRVGVLRVCRDFFMMEPEKQRHVLVHEMLHCHFADIQHCAQELRVLLGLPAYNAWMIGFRLAVEHSVDQLTTLIAEDLDMPKLPKNDTTPVNVG